GFAYAVRDPVTRLEPIKEHGRRTGEYQEVEVDPGVSDKRLLVIENELASVLKMMSREGNILSISLRDAWDGRSLGTLTKNNPVRPTHPPVALVAHIPVDELKRYLDTTEAANGFANRILWLCASRSQLLPDGGQLEAAALNGVVESLQAAIGHAGAVTAM